MKTLGFMLVISTLTLFSCQNNYYSTDDFGNVEKIDAHYHIYTNKNTSIEQAQKDNFKLFAINTY